VPRAGLTPDVIVAEAGVLADRDGLATLTLADVAAHLGVRSPSLYKHVAGLPDLRRRLAVQGLRELKAGLDETVSGTASAPARLHRLGHAYRRFATERPGLYAASLRAPAADEPDVAQAAGDLTAFVLDLLAAFGLPRADLVHAARSVRSALHGFVALEAAGGFGLPQSVDESFERLLDDLEAALRSRRRRLGSARV
jgi:AcrR family transcriptional regulator